MFNNSLRLTNLFIWGCWLFTALSGLSFAGAESKSCNELLHAEPRHWFSLSEHQTYQLVAANYLAGVNENYKNPNNEEFIFFQGLAEGRFDVERYADFNLYREKLDRLVAKSNIKKYHAKRAQIVADFDLLIAASKGLTHKALAQVIENYIYSIEELSLDDGLYFLKPLPIKMRKNLFHRAIEPRLLYPLNLASIYNEDELLNAIGPMGTDLKKYLLTEIYPQHFKTAAADEYRSSATKAKVAIFATALLTCTGFIECSNLINIDQHQRKQFVAAKPKLPNENDRDSFYPSGSINDILNPEFHPSVSAETRNSWIRRFLYDQNKVDPATGQRILEYILAHPSQANSNSAVLLNFLKHSGYRYKVKDFESLRVPVMVENLLILYVRMFAEFESVNQTWSALNQKATQAIRSHIQGWPILLQADVVLLFEQFKQKVFNSKLDFEDLKFDIIVKNLELNSYDQTIIAKNLKLNQYLLAATSITEAQLLAILDYRTSALDSKHHFKEVYKTPDQLSISADLQALYLMLEKFIKSGSVTSLSLSKSHAKAMQAIINDSVYFHSLKVNDQLNVVIRFLVLLNEIKVKASIFDTGSTLDALAAVTAHNDELRLLTLLWWCDQQVGILTLPELKQALELMPKQEYFKLTNNNFFAKHMQQNKIRYQFEPALNKMLLTKHSINLELAYSLLLKTNTLQTTEQRQQLDHLYTELILPTIRRSQADSFELPFYRHGVEALFLARIQQIMLQNQ